MSMVQKIAGQSRLLAVSPAVPPVNGKETRIPPRIFRNTSIMWASKDLDTLTMNTVMAVKLQHTHNRTLLSCYITNIVCVFHLNTRAHIHIG
jgi:hypothetical protein